MTIPFKCRTVNALTILLALTSVYWVKCAPLLLRHVKHHVAQLIVMIARKKMFASHALRDFSVLMFLVQVARKNAMSESQIACVTKVRATLIVSETTHAIMVQWVNSVVSNQLHVVLRTVKCVKKLINALSVRRTISVRVTLQ